MINDEFIKKHSLLECLQEFKGAHKNGTMNRLESVTVEFLALAKKLLYGGHFIVSDNNNKELLKIELRSVEFYYHEENDNLVDQNDEKDRKICDPIMYHKNPKNGKNKKKAFKTGILNPHVSGIDITFEDYAEDKKPEDVVYRASVLLRSFYVIQNNERKVDECSTHLYDYLLMNSPLMPDAEIRIKWVEHNVANNNELYCGHRLNVFKYGDDGEKTTDVDTREWGFAREEITITNVDKNKKKLPPETYHAINQ